MDLYNTFEYDKVKNENKDKYDVVLAKFEEYCCPEINETFERFVFRTRMQKESETFNDFLKDLRTKVKTCNFGTQSDSMIRDQIVIGI